MRIGVDAAPILGDRGGVGWHTYYLLRALVDLKEDVEFVCYTQAGGLQHLMNEGASWGGAPQLRWVEAGRLSMRWRGKLDRLDLFHGTNFKMRTTGRYGGIVTIYDLWLDRYPQYSKKLLGQRVSFYRTRRTAWKARKVITISHHSAHDIKELYGLPPARIEVIPCGVSDEFRPARDAAAFAHLRERLKIPAERCILFVGGADPRKNHELLLKAVAGRPNLLRGRSIVLLGNPSHRFGDIRASAEQVGLSRHIICPGHVSVAELRLLYSHADVFVFPSIYEGFGMPVLEAMACGAPVITSNRTSLPEVAGEAALLVNPEDPQELADAMTRVLEDRGVAEDLRARGFERVKGFTWERAARRTLALYKELCQ